jgi:hypothetical protein
LWGCTFNPWFYHTFDSDDSCDVESIEYSRSYGWPFSSVIAAEANATLRNRGMKYATPPQIVELESGTKMIYPTHSTTYVSGVPTKLSVGFITNTGTELLTEFVGQSEQNPEASYSAGNTTASIRYVDYVSLLMNTSTTAEIIRGKKISEIIFYLLTKYGLNAGQISISSTGPDPVIPVLVVEENKTLKDYIVPLVESVGGRFYQGRAGIFYFKSASDIAVDATAVTSLDTCNDVIDISDVTRGDITNQVRVKYADYTETDLTSFTWRAPETPPIIYPGKTTTITMNVNGKVTQVGNIVSASAFQNTGLTIPQATGISYVFLKTDGDNILVNATSTLLIPAYLGTLTIEYRALIDTSRKEGVFLDGTSVITNGVREMVVDNPYIVGRTQAEIVSSMVLTRLKDGQQTRTVTIKGRPTIEAGDSISIRERVTRWASNDSDGSENLYTCRNYVVTKITTKAGIGQALLCTLEVSPSPYPSRISKWCSGTWCGSSWGGYGCAEIPACI